MEERERESNAALAARNRSAEQAWGVRRVVEINRRLQPQLERLSGEMEAEAAAAAATVEQSNKQGGAGQQPVSRKRRSPYMLTCQEPPSTDSPQSAGVGGGPWGGHRGVKWTEVSGIVALSCCARWRVCWLL